MEPNGVGPMRTRALAELSVAIALAAVLSLIKIKLPHLVYGGSVSLHAVPLVLVALRHGVRAGMLAGASYGAVNFVMTPYFVHPVQLILDYPAAFACLGLAGISTHRGSGTWFVAAMVGLSGSLRLAMHVLSGVVYFAELAPAGTPVWKYSLLYNSSYMIPETVLTGIAAVVVVRRLQPKPDATKSDDPRDHSIQESRP